MSNGIGKKNVKEFYAEFQRAIPEILETIQNCLGIKQLRSSREELDEVGNEYLRQFSENKSPTSLGISLSELRCSVIVYFGTTVIHNFGSKWLYTENKRSDSYGRPSGIEWGPGDWISIQPEEYLDRLEKDNEALSSFFENTRRYFKFKGYDFNVK